MDLIILLLLAGTLGYAVGYFSVIWKLRDVIKDVAKAEGIDLNEDFTVKEKKVTEVYKLDVEEINQMLYLFDRESKDFVCQGSSIDELARLCKEYRNIMMATVVYQNKVFMFVNGHAKEFVG
jgi:hypothetical protein